MTPKRGEKMERTVELGMLLGYYGAFLTERQRSVLAQYVEEDFSLSEIAEREGISRQGVYDTIRRAEAQLDEMELQLGLLKKSRATIEGLRALRGEISAIPVPAAKKEALMGAVSRLQDIWEENDGV